MESNSKLSHPTRRMLIFALVPLSHLLNFPSEFCKVTCIAELHAQCVHYFTTMMTHLFATPAHGLDWIGWPDCHSRIVQGCTCQYLLSPRMWLLHTVPLFLCISKIEEFLAGVLRITSNKDTAPSKNFCNTSSVSKCWAGSEVFFNEFLIGHCLFWMPFSSHPI